MDSSIPPPRLILRVGWRRIAASLASHLHFIAFGPSGIGYVMGNRFRIWLDDSRLLDARRALLHPAFLVAVFVLVVNDHVLKHGVLAGVITGKVSDFAGLFFAPVVVAAVFGVKSRRGLVLSGLVVGGVFAAINTSAVVAAGFDGVASLVYPFHTTVDPTDLVALVAILMGIVVLEPAMSVGAAPIRRLFEYAALTCAGLASIATSPPPCGGVAACLPTEPEQRAQVSILNKTNELHELRIRLPLAGVAFDCDLVAQNPAAYLSDALFGAPYTRLLQSGQEIAIGDPDAEFGGNNVDIPPGECGAALVETDHAPDIVIFWDADLPMKSFPFDADVPPEIPADPQTVVLAANYDEVDSDQMHPWRNRSECGSRADLCAASILAPLAEVPEGARYSWRSNDDPKLHFPRLSVDDLPSDVPEECQVPAPEEAFSWEAPPRGDHVVVGLEEGLDGCHELRLVAAAADPATAQPVGWWVCVPFDQLAPLAPQPDGTTSRIVVLQHSWFDGSNGLSIDVTVQSDDLQVDPFRKIHLVRGSTLPPELDFEFGVVPRAGCAPVETTCGQTAVASDVSISTFDAVLAPGESQSFEVPAVDVQVVRSEYRVARNASCDDSDPTAPPGSPEYFEAVIVLHD